MTVVTRACHRQSRSVPFALRIAPFSSRRLCGWLSLLFLPRYVLMRARRVQAFSTALLAERLQRVHCRGDALHQHLVRGRRRCFGADDVHEPARTWSARLSQWLFVSMRCSIQRRHRFGLTREALELANPISPAFRLKRVVVERCRAPACRWTSSLRPVANDS